MAYVSDTGFAICEKSFVSGDAVPVVGGTIQEVVTCSSVQRVISCTDPNKCCDIGKFANLCVGDIGVSVAIAVIPKSGVRDTTTFADLDISPEGAFGDLTLGVDIGGIGG